MNIPFILPAKLPYLDTFVTNGNWHCFYLDENSAEIAWQLLDDTAQPLVSGNWSVPPDVLNVWGTNNDVVTKALVAAEPWDCYK